jgi:cobaltochelatase CobS subunit
MTTPKYTAGSITSSIICAALSHSKIVQSDTSTPWIDNKKLTEDLTEILTSSIKKDSSPLFVHLRDVLGVDVNTIRAAATVMGVLEINELIDAIREDDVSAFCDPSLAIEDLKLFLLELYEPKDNETKDPFNTTEEGNTMTATPISPIDNNMKSAINALLSQASSGVIKDIDSILNEKAALENAVQETKQELTKALMKAKSAPMVMTGTSPTALGELTFEIVEVMAKDLFTFNGKKANKGMDFLVPTLVWKDSTGAVVQHPEVPNIDDNYQFNTTNTLMFLTATLRNMNSWLFGHTGTGKSTFVEQVAARIGWPVTRINLDSSMERADLVGQTTLAEENGTTVSRYEEGILPRAMQRPGFLLMDEIDAGRPDILFVVQRALESKGLMLTEDNGRIIQPHPLFRFTATANTRGQGDEYGMYSGTRTMNAAMVDRFTAFIEFEYMQPKEESRLLQTLTPSLDVDVADKMCQFAKEVRSAFAKGEVYSTISPRGLTVFADTYMTFVSQGIPNDTAFTYAMHLSVLNKVTSDNKQKFLELASRVFGFSIK